MVERRLRGPGAVAGLVACAALLAVAMFGSGRPATLCAGGCMTRGVPVPMAGRQQAIHHSVSKKLAAQELWTEAGRLADTRVERGRIQALDDVSSEFDPVEDADSNYGRVIGVREVSRTNPAVAEDMDVAPERKGRVQMLDDTLHDDDAWRNAVELGDKDHEWKTYEPDESVMGLPYQAPAWGKSVQSAVVNNPARNWAALNNPASADVIVE